MLNGAGRTTVVVEAASVARVGLFSTGVAFLFTASGIRGLGAAAGFEGGAGGNFSTGGVRGAGGSGPGAGDGNAVASDHASVNETTDPTAGGAAPVAGGGKAVLYRWARTTKSLKSTLPSPVKSPPAAVFPTVL